MTLVVWRHGEEVVARIRSTIVGDPGAPVEVTACAGTEAILRVVETWLDGIRTRR